ncbi:MAG: BREX system Lon protease-like protein BrxL, partial [Ruminiclostridium sp.]|nr:BREX system Lon protease-like protein BrxL [Ruminiclostridium sp.]
MKENIFYGDDTREELYRKLRSNFDGKIVRKDLTKRIKEGANVPVYVLEFLLGQYCSSDDEEVVKDGVETVKRILSENYVRPDESEKVLSKLRQRGSMSIIDRVTVTLNLKTDCYEALFSNLGLGDIPISENYPQKYDRLLCGGIWCIIQLEYDSSDALADAITGQGKSRKGSPFITINKLTPIQMPYVDMDELKEGRKAFTKDEWIDVLLRSVGM